MYSQFMMNGQKNIK